MSVPPIVGDKTRPRPNAAQRIRALGPNFHAMAEFHFTSWNRWVQSTGSSWYTAGVTARERMAAAGYDFARGDIWVVNELSSAVRRGTGNARANIREMLRGLYEGGGRPTRGAVLVVGVGQRSTTDTSLLQTNLQNWFTDSAFWADMNTYVSDWSQEVYGDVRSHAVPGAPEQVRRDYLNEYLQHKLVLAGVGPPTIETARSYLNATFSPLANAAWEREAGYGWTMVSAEQMGAYVSSQVHALRYFSATTGQPQDRWGFAWAPRNAAAIPAAEFAARSGLVLDRLAAAIRDSAATPDAADPGSAACGPPGQNVHCVLDLEGARFNEAWKSFRTWTQPVLSFATPAQTIPAGTPSAPISLELDTGSGLAVTTPVPLTVTVSSSSSSGTFAASLEGPWTRTLPLTIAAGTRTTASLLLPGHERRQPRADGSGHGSNERHPDADGDARATDRAHDHAPNGARAGACVAGSRCRGHRCLRQRLPGRGGLVDDAGRDRDAHVEDRQHDVVHRRAHRRARDGEGDGRRTGVHALRVGSVAGHAGGASHRVDHLPGAAEPRPRERGGPRRSGEGRLTRDGPRPRQA